MLWYLTLREPVFKPPDWLFPGAWTAIEAGLATTARGTDRCTNESAGVMGLGCFHDRGLEPLIFKRHNLGVSAVAAAGLVATSAAFAHKAKRVAKTASRAGFPLVGWVAFATVLTATIWHMNSRKSR